MVHLVVTPARIGSWQRSLESARNNVLPPTSMVSPISLFSILQQPPGHLQQHVNDGMRDPFTVRVLDLPAEARERGLTGGVRGRLRYYAPDAEPYGLARC